MEKSFFSPFIQKTSIVCSCTVLGVLCKEESEKLPLFES